MRKATPTKMAATWSNTVANCAVEFRALRASNLTIRDSTLRAIIAAPPEGHEWPTILLRRCKCAGGQQSGVPKGLQCQCRGIAGAPRASVRVARSALFKGPPALFLACIIRAHCSGSRFLGGTSPTLKWAWWSLRTAWPLPQPAFPLACWCPQSWLPSSG